MSLTKELAKQILRDYADGLCEVSIRMVDHIGDPKKIERMHPTEIIMLSMLDLARQNNSLQKAENAIVKMADFIRKSQAQNK